MKQYETWILNELLDKYESSSLYLGKNQIAVSISVSFTKKVIPEYFDETIDTYEIIHDKMKELELDGFIRIGWKNRKVGHIIEKVFLNVDNISMIYARLGRKTKEEKEMHVREILEQEENQTNIIVQNFSKWIQQRMEMGESVKRYVDIDNPKELELLLKAVCCVTENKEELFVREFSILHFQDSKIFEMIAGKVTDIIGEFSNRGLEDLTKEQILEEFNIYHNPSMIMMKGKGILQIGGNKIDLEKLIGGIGIQSQDLEQLQFVKDHSIKFVLTIENLTVFHRWREKDTLMIYLAGYHNEAKRVFLQKIYEAYPEAEYRHFGDIDCGGFRILHDLREKTKIPFRAYCMDKKTMERCIAYAKDLTQTDIRELNRMLALEVYQEYREVFEYMFEMRKKLEQECVYREENLSFFITK